jgi:hypothetical protein
MLKVKKLTPICQLRHSSTGTDSNVDRAKEETIIKQIAMTITILSMIPISFMV